MSDFRDWQRNVADRYKESTLEEIRDDLRATSHPFAVMMENWKGDFNIGTCIRNANGFNAEKVFYFGKKKFDRRGAVGAYHYVDLQHLATIDEVEKLKEEYFLVGIDNNINRPSTPLSEVDWERPVRHFTNVREMSFKERITYMVSKTNDIKKPLFIFGEEGEGITESVLDLCDMCVHLDMYGSIRSFNAGTTSGIVMWAVVNGIYRQKSPWEREIFGTYISPEEDIEDFNKPLYPRRSCLQTRITNPNVLKVTPWEKSKDSF